MSDFYSILTPSSQELFTAWEKNITALNVYQLFGPGNSTHSVLARVIDDNEKVVLSIILETTVPAMEWLDAYLTKWDSEDDSEDESDDDYFDDFEVEESTTTETTVSDSVYHSV